MPFALHASGAPDRNTRSAAYPRSYSRSTLFELQCQSLRPAPSAARTRRPRDRNSRCCSAPRDIDGVHGRATALRPPPACAPRCQSATTVRPRRPPAAHCKSRNTPVSLPRRPGPRTWMQPSVAQRCRSNRAICVIRQREHFRRQLLFVRALVEDAEFLEPARRRRPHASDCHCRRSPTGARGPAPRVASTVLPKRLGCFAHCERCFPPTPSCNAEADDCR